MDPHPLLEATSRLAFCAYLHDLGKPAHVSLTFNVPNSVRQGEKPCTR